MSLSKISGSPDRSASSAQRVCCLQPEFRMSCFRTGRRTDSPGWDWTCNPKPPGSNPALNILVNGNGKQLVIK